MLTLVNVIHEEGLKRERMDGVECLRAMLCNGMVLVIGWYLRITSNFVGFFFFFFRLSHTLPDGWYFWFF